MNQEIINYIKEARQHGLTDNEIKISLIQAGWGVEIIGDNYAHLKALGNQPKQNKDEDIKPTEQSSSLPTNSNQLNVVQTQQSKVSAAQPLQARINSSFISESTEAKPLYKKAAFLISLFLFLAIAGGASAYYVLIYTSPVKVWKKFIELKGDKILSSNLKFAYKDNNPGAQEDLGGLPISNIKLEIGGKAYVNTSDENNPESSSEFTYSFASGNTNFSTGFEYKLIGKKLYLNVGNNPFTQSIFNSLGKGKKIEWVSLDLDELQKKAETDPSQNAQKIKEIFSSQYVEELKKIWTDAVFVKMDSYRGRENIDGKSTLHFSNSLDKEAIKATFTAILDKIIQSIKNTGEDIKDEDVNSVKFAINAIVDKLEVREFETWIGIKDFKMYKVKIITSAPSVMSAIQSTMGSAQEKSKDAKRLADIRQMASALELYYNDYSRYPDSKNGQPIGLSPKYFSDLPVAPIPPGGNCTDYYNTYWYEVKAENENNPPTRLAPGQWYNMTFCLGTETGGYKAGINKLSPMGIMPVEGCPSTPDKCYKNGLPESSSTVVSEINNEKSQQEKIKETIDKINFDAEINIEANYSDYGVKKEVKAPEGAFDLIELFESQNNLIPLM